jgi:hypothetical protein
VQIPNQENEMRRLMTVLAASALLIIGAGIVTAFAPTAGDPPMPLVLGMLGTALLIAMGPRLSHPVTVRRHRDFPD